MGGIYMCHPASFPACRIVEAPAQHSPNRELAAERGLAAVWHAFRKAGFPRELTFVSLDLAEVYLALGKGWRRRG